MQIKKQKDNDNIADIRRAIGRILGHAGCGVALAGAMFVACVCTSWPRDVTPSNMDVISGRMDSLRRRDAADIVRMLAASQNTRLTRDTIDLSSMRGAALNNIVVGRYDAGRDVAQSHWFQDAGGIAFGRKSVARLNNYSKNGDYHGIRHAMNARLMSHSAAPLSPDVFIADEISARVASYLADLCDMPRIMAGAVSPNVSYKIGGEYSLHDVADIALANAVYELASGVKFTGKTDTHGTHENSAGSRGAVIDGETLIDEMMTFEINGRPENILRHASPDVRGAVHNLMRRYAER